MPFAIQKVGTGYRLYNLEKKKYSKRTFKSVQSAENMRRVYMNYDRKKKK